MNAHGRATICQTLSRVVAALSIALVAWCAGAEEPVGQAVYLKKCASCHGAAGEGTSKHDDRLVGSKSVAELSRYIEEFMPEEKPGNCTGEEARQVATYIHHAFYSPLAQARIRPPRIELSRLTVLQHRNAVSDLVASFAKQSQRGEQRGLNALYANSGRKFDPGKRVAERVDPQIAFDFGTEGPPIEGLNAEEYGVRWQGGLFAPRSGDYEIIVQSKNGFRLWLNDEQEELIGAWVRSGDRTEERATIHLLGGRVYPLRLEFFKEKKERSADCRLVWKRPDRVAETIGSEYLAPGRFPEVFVPTAKFPPDDRSLGFERGTAVSRQWDQATTAAAIETADYIDNHLPQLVGYRAGYPARGQHIREFCYDFVSRAFRRPLSQQDRAFYVDRQFDKVDAPEQAARLVVLLALKSPRFLYLAVPSESPADYRRAESISFGLLDSIPDEALRVAASQGKLATREQVAAQVKRLLDNPRTRGKARQFFHEWLQLSHARDVVKDADAFPKFDDTLLSNLRDSLDLQLNRAMWGESADFRQLLLSETHIFNGRLSNYYGGDLPSEASYQALKLTGQRRAGVLTHPLIMASFAYTEDSSPIHRGVFVARDLMGRTLRPPPEAFAPLSPKLHPDLSTRQRVTLQTKPRACQGCHNMINPLGFALEHFDAVGRYREQEKNRPIDTAGTVMSADGSIVKFGQAVDLARYLAHSREAQAAFVEAMFHHFVKQPVRAYGQDRPDQLHAGFAKSQFDMRQLLTDIIVTAAFPPDKD